MKKLFWTTLVAYAAAWCTHLYTATSALRGFFGDASLAFLIYLSNSTLFNKSDNVVHLFSVGFPRDFQLFLSAIGLQVALSLGITDPQTLKYIFVFWQFFLPGFLYLLLFFFLWRAGKTAWIIFPLISWAILSVPIDWASINSTRWAVPLFWMHFFLVIFADRKIRPVPLVATVLLGGAMWGGLYESVVLHGLLCMALSALLWYRDKNKTPLLYALAALPGMIRTVSSYIGVGHTSPNGFHEQMLSYMFVHPYFLFIGLALCFIFVLWFASRIVPSHFFVFMGLFFMAGGIVLEAPPPSVWWQSEVRFDYIVLTLALMAWAGTMKAFGLSPASFARPAASVAFLTGTILWLMQSQQTYNWLDCNAQYNANKGDKPLIIGNGISSLFKATDKMSILPQQDYSSCVWDWATPWTDLLLNGDKPIKQWPILTFWQDFSFIEKDGTPYLHTNNWTLTSPSVLVSGADLPIKTKLYDLTPLYQELGDGPLVERTSCMPPEQSGGYWQKHLTGLDDDKRRLMFACPRQ
jgi:hypothetical protein